MRALRQQFGVSASEYLYEMPWWEVQLLLDADVSSGEPVRPSKLESAPDWLKQLPLGG